MLTVSKEVRRAVGPATRPRPATPHCARTPEGAGYGRRNSTVVTRAAGNVARTRGALRIAGGPTRELGPPRVSRRPASQLRCGARWGPPSGRSRQPHIAPSAPEGAGYGRRNSTVVARADRRVARAGETVCIAGDLIRESSPASVSRRPASRSVARGGARHPAEAGNPTLRHGAPGGAGYGRRNSTVVARADRRVARAGRHGGAGGCLSAGATRGRGAAPGVGVPFAAVTGAERPD